MITLPATQAKPRQALRWITTDPVHLQPGELQEQHRAGSGKTRIQALFRFARHRMDVLLAMLRDGTFYEPRSTETATADHSALMKDTKAPPELRAASASVLLASDVPDPRTAVPPTARPALHRPFRDG
ncbi:hypothetical protein ACIPSA_50310 [Streptomyces sp. NPDC086549]|uniref:hypothetical protein n=1 Tax=Streptomyces sp. NPDC086549 TaxID=3365752 RepID=UPI0037F6C700